MPQRYSVDWSDPPFPEIVPDEMVAYPDGYTFTQAKQSILSTLRDRIDGTRAVMAEVRKLRAADIARRGSE